MINIVKEGLWKQFGASIDMLKSAIELWPDEYWYSDRKFFYNAYHVLFFLDYYLTMPPKNFIPGLPRTITSLDQIPADAIDDIMPDKIYSKTELLQYLQSSREKCRQLINGLTAESLADRWIEEDDDRNFALLEIILYNMRHVQHHAAQLNLFLRQKIDNAPQWVGRTKD